MVKGKLAPRQRISLLLDERGLQAGVSLWTIFEPNLELFGRKNRTDVSTRLIFAGSNDSCSALVTPPVPSPAGWRNVTNVALHARPRPEVMRPVGKVAAAPHAHGGLSPGAMRRVQEYVETHLGESIDLVMLAAVAGLWKAGRVIVVFQPHRYSRTKLLAKEFGPALKAADFAYVMDVYPAGEKPMKGVSSRLILDSMKRAGVAGAPFPGALELSKQLKPGDVVLTLGAGDVWKVGEDLLRRRRGGSATTI